jgi:hypothetical protein
MHKTLVLTLSAVAVVSGLLLSTETASAENDPVLTYPTGTRLFAAPEAPVSVVATNLGGATIKPSEFEVWYQCTTSTLTGSLERNTGSLFEITITKASFGGTAGESSCTGLGSFTTDTGNGVPWCLRSTNSMAEDEFQIRGNSCTKEPRSLTVTIAGCSYERTTPISGTFTTDTTGDGVLWFSNAKFVKEPNQVFCGNFTYLEATYTLERDTTSSADPLYIS